VSFSNLEIAINCAKRARLEEVRRSDGGWKFITVDAPLTFGNQIPTELPYSRTYDTKAMINRIRVISKYVKGGFPKDQLVRTGVSAGED
jgi:hypothetical protein